MIASPLLISRDQSADLFRDDFVELGNWFRHLAVVCEFRAASWFEGSGTGFPLYKSVQSRECVHGRCKPNFLGAFSDKKML